MKITREWLQCIHRGETKNVNENFRMVDVDKSRYWMARGQTRNNNECPTDFQHRYENKSSGIKDFRYKTRKVLN